MRALQKLNKKIISIILAIAMFLSTGITTVFADGLSPEDQLRANISEMNSSVDSLRNLTTNNTQINDAVSSLLDSTNRIRVYANGVNVSDRIIIENGEFKYQTYQVFPSGYVENNGMDNDNKNSLVESAQSITSQINSVLNELEPVLQKINSADERGNDIISANEISTLINTLNSITQNIVNDGKNVSNDIVSNLGNGLDNLSTDGVRYDLEILLDKTNELKSKNESNNYDNSDVDNLISSINTELNSNTPSEDNYDMYLTTYQSLLDEYVDTYTDELLEEAIQGSDLGVTNSKLSELVGYVSESLDTFNSKVDAKLDEYQIPTNEEDRTNGSAELNNLKTLENSAPAASNFYNDDVRTKLDEKIELYNKNTNANIEKLSVIGSEYNKSQIDAGRITVYVANGVEEVDLQVTPESDTATYSYTGNTGLAVGNNTITITVTAENGNTREYTITVYRAPSEEEQVGDASDTSNNNNVVPLTNTTDENKEENTNEEISKAVVSTSSIKADTTDKKDTTKKSNTSDSKDKYNEEIEKEGMSPLTIILIIVGIALVGFGIYMLFGKDEDNEEDIKYEKPVKEEKVEIKKVEVKNNKKTTKNNNSKKSSTNNKKNSTNSKKNKSNKK